MADQNNVVEAITDPVTGEDAWKNRTYIVGVVGGAIVGALSALLYVRSAEESIEERLLARLHRRSRRHRPLRFSRCWLRARKGS